jgi:hypothetical protein
MLSLSYATGGQRYPAISDHCSVSSPQILPRWLGNYQTERQHASKSSHITTDMQAGINALQNRTQRHRSSRNRDMTSLNGFFRRFVTNLHHFRLLMCLLIRVDLICDKDMVSVWRDDHHRGPGRGCSSPCMRAAILPYANLHCCAGKSVDFTLKVFPKDACINCV